MTDHLYNLMCQITEEAKSLWRIKKYYESEAGDCTQCQTVWNNLIADKERTITELKTLLKQHLAKD